MQAVSILGQSKPYFSLMLAKQDARRMVLDGLLDWLNDEYFVSHPAKRFGVVTQHGPQISKRALEFLSTITSKLADEHCSVEESQTPCGIRYRCYLVVTLGEREMEYLVKIFGQFAGLSLKADSSRETTAS